MIETLYGTAAAIVYIFIVRFFSKHYTARLFAATTLVAIAFIYVGFSLKGNPPAFIILECTFAMALYFLALIGYTKRSSLLAYGIILHGLWDIFHHFFIKTDVPTYWPPFCFMIDIIDGLYFLFIFRVQERRVPASN